MYPVTYEADYVEHRSRLTNFFRQLIAIPWWIVLAIYGIGASIAVVIAWFAIVFTGRYPEGLYEFLAKYLRMNARVGGFVAHMTDEFPAFNGDPDDAYPIRVGIPPPQAAYSRAKTALRLIVGIPVMVLAWVWGVIVAVVSFISFLAILFTGRQGDGLFKPLVQGETYLARANSYFLLLTEDYPPFSEEPSTAGAGQLPSSGPPAGAPPTAGQEQRQPPPPGT